jgi:hypothetical protein
VLRKLIEGRDWLFADDCYHIDLSHLSAAVHMSRDLEPGDDMRRARELCAYGQRLAPAFRSQGEPPFEDHYRDHDVYFSILLGEKVEEGLAHFQAKVEAQAEEGDPGPAEILVQLLLRLGRPAEALEVAKRHLAPMDNAWLTRLVEVCRQAGNFRALAEAAQQHGNPVQFVAGLLASQTA